MNFLEQNKKLIKAGLIAMYSNKTIKTEQPQMYLTHKQIDGIIDYIERVGCGEDIEAFIDETILCFYGFDENGKPIELE